MNNHNQNRLEEANNAKDRADKAKILEERNDKSKAFYRDWEEQQKRDQVIMPIDELPLADIEMEKNEERDKDATKKSSSSERI